MPPRLFSRYTFATGVSDGVSPMYLTGREPFRFRSYPDNRRHIVRDGDSLFSLASRFFSPMPQAPQLWWVIADFQPDPILDPTLRLDVGRVLVIPSIRTVQEDIFSAARRLE